MSNEIVKITLQDLMKKNIPEEDPNLLELCYPLLVNGQEIICNVRHACA